MKTMICRNCEQELPEEQFELYPTGTRRRVCRHCHYVLHQRASRRRWVLRERARVLLGR
ncbi:MAG: hypothetical protein IJ637_03175 [Prevotella sp.]|nr:hypothetical protein [Prevotella sp.]